eukprot:Phypoly_transcript_08222.p1 GENE.Phypoly_transcript_08222~~Phypoly_transcript_08222.p1  ORF type:complete len:245 (+),score=31.69 Phypoly_transcript_08222:355-1089(+)
MAQSGITISALSASKARKYYENLGWHVVPFKIASQKLNTTKLLSRTHKNKENIQAADFSEKEASQLIPLHHFYAQHFNGPHCRSKMQYWTKWIKAESFGNAWVVMNHDGEVGGFACFGVPNPGTLVVKDFCVGSERWVQEQGREVLQQLVEHFVRHKKQDIGDHTELIIKYPSAIMGSDSAKLYVENEVEIERKESYLYRVLGGTVPSDTFIAGTVVGLSVNVTVGERSGECILAISRTCEKKL